MVTRRHIPSAPEGPTLNAEQLRARIGRLQDCIESLERFNPQDVRKRYGVPEVLELEASIKGALAAAFGDATPSYNRYRRATSLDNGPHYARVGNPFGRGSEIDYDEQDARDARKYLAEGKEQAISLLKQAISALSYELADREQETATSFENHFSTEVVPLSSRKIFVVHGHDEGARETVARFIERVGFEAIILHEKASQGRTVIEKIERHGDVGFAVILLTPDDFGGKNGTTAQPRARQNVILELGYFIGRLGREKVCALLRGEVEVPSDFGGVVYVPFDEGWKIALAKELASAGYEFDWNNVMNS